MTSITTAISDYLHYCEYQKKLDPKTIKAYRIDLAQFAAHAASEEGALSKECISKYAQKLHNENKPKTVKRKIACLRAFTNYLEYEEEIDSNPFQKMRLSFREPTVLPKALSLGSVRKLLKVSHLSLSDSGSEYRRNATLRDVAVLELLFATGLRVSELCSITDSNIDLHEGRIMVNGKGARERIVFITNPEALSVLRKYRKAFAATIGQVGFFFVNRLGNRLSEQSVREMLKGYVAKAQLPGKITPHTLRHSFATLMLEEDVDIRYIQSVLGHSSISTTQIYTYVSLSKQKSIMAKKHPRNKMQF